MHASVPIVAGAALQAYGLARRWRMPAPTPLALDGPEETSEEVFAELGCRPPAVEPRRSVAAAAAG